MRAWAALAILASATAITAQVPSGARVVLGDMNGFEADADSAIRHASVPIELVERKEDAAYIVDGKIELRAPTRKNPLPGDYPNAFIFMSVSRISDGEVMFSCRANKHNSDHAAREAFQKCAKRLRDEITGK
jgi:hypothetical protein